MKVRFFISLVLAVLLGIPGLPASRATEPTPTPPLYNIFNDNDEIVLGQQAAAETDKTLPMVSDSLIQNYVNDLGQRIVKESRRANIPYHFKVIDSRQINAFALPAGYVYVERGLLHTADTESELVGAMSHEVGHVVARHGLANVSRVTWVKMAVEQAKALGVLDPQTVQQIFDLTGGVAFLFANAEFSREQESEADLLGSYNAVRAGWDPNGAVVLFRKFEKMEGKSDLIKRLLSSHPQPGDRATAVSAEIKTMNLPPNLTVDSPAFQAMKQRLNELPPPPPDPREKKE